MAIKITFPQYLADEPYRKITINVVNSPGYAESAKGAAKRVWDAAKELADNGYESGLASLSSSSGKGSSTVASFVLPIPNELNDSQQHDWTTERGLAGTFMQGLEQQGIAQAAGGKIASVVGNASEAVPLVGAGISAAAGMPLGNLLGSMSNAAGTRKPLGDPGYFQNYTGSQPRTFNMTFDLVPNNPQEARDMLELVYLLKRYSSPKTTIEGVSLLAPHYFDISIANQYIDKIISMSGVVLQNIVVNYSADGAMQMTPDGIPKYMQLGLTFVERKMRTEKDFASSINTLSSDPSSGAAG